MSAKNAAGQWTYGDIWNQYPIQPGAPWKCSKTGSIFGVYDLFDGLPSYMKQADLVVVDPPWNTALLNGFYTKAGQKDVKKDFDAFAEMLFQRIREIGPAACYVEVGAQKVKLFQSKLAELYPQVQTWKGTYYKKRPCYFLRGGQQPLGRDFAGIDDEQFPYYAMAAEKSLSCVADPCTGRGLMAETAYKLGKRFVGTELSRFRMAVTLQKCVAQGAQFPTLAP